jgi:hypothetical protein
MSYEFDETNRSDRRMHIVLGCVIGAVVLGCVWLTVHVHNVSSARHARFMSQCMQDHKEYECTAMWRAGDREPPTLIFIPTGR